MQTVKQIQAQAVAIAKRDAAERLVGALAQSIRGYWLVATGERYALMRELVDNFSNTKNRTEWLQWLDDDDNLNQCLRNGRRMRDWPGPYGDMVSGADLALLGQSPDCLGRFGEDYVYAASESWWPA